MELKVAQKQHQLIIEGERGDSGVGIEFSVPPLLPSAAASGFVSTQIILLSLSRITMSRALR